MNKLLDSKKEGILPAAISDKELADSCMAYSVWLGLVPEEKSP